MELRILQYFLALTQEKSISAAAESLHLTQPTLSRQLMDLERELGVKLFARGKRKITLTEEGFLLKKRAGEILELVHKTKQEFSVPEGEVSGDIYIGGGETHAMRLVADIIRELRQEYPAIRFHIYSGIADDVMERLDKGLLDFGLLIDPANIAQYHSVCLPAKDVWGVLMRKDDSLAEKKAIQPQDLWDAPLISSRQRFISKKMTEWFGKDSSELNLVATYNLVYNASIMVEKGIGYALCIDRLVNTAGKNQLCFRPLSPRLESDLFLVWKKNQVFGKAPELFLERLNQRFGHSLGQKGL